MDEEATTQPARCPSCGRLLPPDAAEALCPSCVLRAALDSVSQDGLQTTDSAAVPGDEGETPPLRAGVEWGDYRIGRPLGRGGMGDVYEASHATTGRRVALKVLRRPLSGPAERARFLREGQLAASISHPRTVFVFAAEEIDGVPVIAMELLPGGTLKDRVRESGPLSPVDAAAAALDIVSGLEAAHVAGILHRDVKPSNCFVDHDGSVKIGDFGISISTLPPRPWSESASPGFQGTPQFAAPEQLRGEPLDIRADIYAVGATLYYLLTARPPFEAGDLHELIERVTQDPVPSPRSLGPGIPAGLAALVVRCLSKAPSDRPQSYAEIAEALRPLAGPDQAAAPLGARVLAGLVDSLLVGLPLGLFDILRAFAGDGPAPGQTPLRWGWVGLGLYYVILEAARGGSLGKSVFGLQVVSAAGPPRLTLVLLRTSTFVLPGFIMSAVRLWHGPVTVFPFSLLPDTWGQPLLALAILAPLFIAARPRNGWSGLHDLVSATRVVSQSVPARRPLPAFRPPTRAGTSRSVGRLGPFELVHDIGLTDRGTLIQAFDPVLRRDVWIHRLATGAPDSTPARRDVSRVARLHWLMGPRDDSAWDAFEAPRGRPLLAVGKPVEWPMLRAWLADLAEELARAEREGTLPAPTLGHVWVRDDGRLTLLDFPYPPVIEFDHTAVSSSTPLDLIPAVATYVRARAPHAGMYPLSFLTRLQEWTRNPPVTMQALRTQTAAFTSTIDRVTSARRALPTALSLVPVVMWTIGGLAAIPAMRTMRTFEHATMLWWLDALSAARPDQSPFEPDTRRAAERYVAERFRASLSDETLWRGITPYPERQRTRHRLAQQLLEQYEPDPGSLATLAEELGPQIARAEAESRVVADRAGPFVVLVVSTLSAIVLVIVMVVHLVSSAVVRGGIVSRAAGLAVVTAEGREISRWRSVGRAVVAWSPALVWCVYLGVSLRGADGVPLPHSPLLAAALTHAVLAVGVIMTVMRPSRGPHDALVNVWVVPR